MFRVWLVFWGISGFLWAVEEDRRFSCPQKMLEMTEAALGARTGTFHLSAEMVEQLSSRPGFSDRFQNLLALHDFLSTEVAFVEILSDKLAQPAYSVRSRLVQDALQEAGLNIPVAARAVLASALEAFPSIEDPTDPEVSRRRRMLADQILSSVTGPELIALYQTWRVDESSAGLLDGAGFLDIKTIDQFKTLVRDREKSQKVYQSYRNALLVYAQAKVNLFFSKTESADLTAPQANLEFEYYLAQLKVAANARPFLTRLMMVASFYPPVLSAEKVQATLCGVVVSAMAGLRHELLSVQRNECGTADQKAASPDLPADDAASGEFVCLSHPAPTRPARSRRKQHPEPAQEVSVPVELYSVVEGELSEEEADALFQRMSPTPTHYSKFIRALNEAKRKLTEQQFLKFRTRIVSTLRNLDNGVPPPQAGGLYWGERGVWEQRPLGTSTTHRFFVGQIDGRCFILLLCSDVKSGNGWERNLIIGLKREVQLLKGKLK